MINEIINYDFNPQEIYQILEEGDSLTKGASQ